MPGFLVCAPRSTSDATVACPGQNIELFRRETCVRARLRACRGEKSRQIAAALLAGVATIANAAAASQADHAHAPDRRSGLSKPAPCVRLGLSALQRQSVQF